MAISAKLQLLIKKDIPTVDIYFLGPLRHLIVTWKKANCQKPIRRLGPYCFYANDQAVIIRYATNAELKTIRALKPKRCIYVIDDDLWGMQKDSSLPDDYHHYLAPFKARILPQIIEMSDLIVAPNKLILDRFPDHELQLLDPSYTFLCRDFSHFTNSRHINMIFTGSHTHLADLDFIAPVLKDLSERYENITLTTYLGKRAPDCLTGQENIINLGEQTWASYKKRMATQRFHIALAPYKETPFNRARSINKVFDHAAFGAAGVYSRLPPLADIVEHDKNGILVEEEVSAWGAAIEMLISNPQKAHHLAQNGLDLAQGAGDPARVASFWKQILGLEGSGQ